MQTKLQYLLCMTSKTDGSQVLSSCLLSLPHLLGANYFLLPCNTSELNKFMCSKSNRDGQLCGKCREGFAPPVYSYSLTCVNCTDYNLNWLKYLAVAFGPLTAFSIGVILFHISPASPYLHGFILAASIICVPNIVRIIVQDDEEHPHTSYHVYQSMLCFLGMINLDFFRVVYKPFCVHPSLTLLHALAMDYIIAVYPLIIVIVTYFLVSLYIRSVGSLLAYGNL